MNISPINSAYIQSYTPAKKSPCKNKSGKTRFLLAGAAAAAVTGALILALHNRNLVKKPVENLKQNEFMKAIKEASVDNYMATPSNIRNGTFNMDLHSHSNHSDGWGSVQKLLDEASEYADEVYEKTGKKFTMALTDHDRVSGVSEALDIIEKNPEKYKNLNFIPGVELSFSFNSNNKVKSGEVLAYFIEPDSKEMKTLVLDLNKNRNKMIDESIEQLGKGFSRSDMENYFINKDGETFAYNLHYRIRNYAQIKNRINKIALEKDRSSDQLYKQIMDGYVFEGGGRVPKPYVSPEGLDDYLKRKNIQTNTKMLDDGIDEICNKFFPKIQDGKVVSNTENSFEKIIDTLKGNDDVMLGFAHPYFTSEQMGNYKKEFDKLLNYANGKVKFSENYHQAYSSKIPKDRINEVNEYLLSKNLIPIGGRDNHKARFMP